MKKCLFVIFAIILLSIQSDKKSLLCHQWVQFAFKPEIGAPLKLIDSMESVRISFNEDGSFDESRHLGQLKTTGNWYLNADETKMEFTITSFDGRPVPPVPETTYHYNIIILKLTADTLIYGHENYRGKEGGPMTYNHYDLFFVRQQ